MRKLKSLNISIKKRSLFVLLFISLFVFCVFAKKRISGVFTTLVIIEENENGSIVKGNSPVSDGVFDALWDRDECIFFDMKIDKPIKIIDDQLDITPFMGLARGAGADSILLIKFNYFSEKKGSTLQIRTGEVYYNLYSLSDLQSLRNEKKDLMIDKNVELSKKNLSLKKIGYDFLNEIYK